tara:strand:+ start:437 stop:676 length:240 start_codon:yes stop_codon:yes gene_type:complete
MKLIDKLKPEVIEALDEAKIQYSSSHRSIFATLNSVSEYRDLTVDQLNLIIAYLPQDLKPHSSIGWMYGDNILDKKHRL